MQTPIKELTEYLAYRNQMSACCFFALSSMISVLKSAC